MKTAMLSLAAAGLISLGGCAKSCEDLAKEVREKTADGLHAAADAYAGGTSQSDAQAKMQDLQKELQELQTEMANKQCSPSLLL